jgi:hypothetical protein
LLLCQQLQQAQLSLPEQHLLLQQETPAANCQLLLLNLLLLLMLLLLMLLLVPLLLVVLTAHQLLSPHPHL